MPNVLPTIQTPRAHTVELGTRENGRVINNATMIEVPGLVTPSGPTRIIVHETNDGSPNAMYDPNYRVFELSSELVDNLKPPSQIEKSTRTAEGVRQLEIRRKNYVEVVIAHEDAHRVFEHQTEPDIASVTANLLSPKYQDEVREMLTELYRVMPAYQERFAKLRSARALASEIFAIASFAHLPDGMKDTWFGMTHYQNNPKDRKYFDSAIKLYEKMNADGNNVWEKLLGSKSTHQYRAYTMRKAVEAHVNKR